MKVTYIDPNGVILTVFEFAKYDEPPFVPAVGTVVKFPENETTYLASRVELEFISGRGSWTPEVTVRLRKLEY